MLEHYNSTRTLDLATDSIPEDETALFSTGSPPADAGEQHLTAALSCVRADSKVTWRLDHSSSAGRTESLHSSGAQELFPGGEQQPGTHCADGAGLALANGNGIAVQPSPFAAAAFDPQKQKSAELDPEARASQLYLDLRPFMNCAPFSVR